MLAWESLDILSYGAGTPSTTLALMSCEYARHGPPYPHPQVPVYDAVIFCDLHSEPSWVYAQAEFAAAACREAGIPFYRLDADLYGDFTRSFGHARTACIPFWTLSDDGNKGRMPRQCTYDNKIKVIEKFVRYNLLCYKPRERTLSIDVRAHNLHMGIMWEERQWAKESKQTLFTNRYPLVELGWTRAGNQGKLLLVLPISYQLFYHHIREHEPDCYACALQVDELVETHQVHPPLKRACQKVMAELDAEGVPYRQDTEIGIMIETPASVFVSEEIKRSGLLLCRHQRSDPIHPGL